MHSQLSLFLYTRIHNPLPHFLERKTSEKFYLWRYMDIKGVTTCSQGVFFIIPFNLTETPFSIGFDFKFHNETPQLFWAKYHFYMLVINCFNINYQIYQTVSF